MLNIISLGAGVQSTTMALMAAAGEITPMPDCAIFADTGAEPVAVYKHLEMLKSALPFPIHIVDNGNLKDDLLGGMNSTYNAFGAIPFYIDRIAFGEPNAMGRRQCTREYKLDPIRKMTRLLLGYKPGQRIPHGLVNTWIGISTDEASRMKPSRDEWINNIWPLVDAGMNRSDCKAWLSRNNFPTPPKSACVFCPYMSNEQWNIIKTTEPESFDIAVAIDNAIREQAGKRENFSGVPYLHKSLMPISAVEFTNSNQSDLFDEECEGMCGV
jgi:hypothetical protein